MEALIKDCMIHIFTFLSAEDLMRASSVCKDWNDAAETPWLWRRICLQRWSFCNVLRKGENPLTWKKYFLRRSHLEEKMAQGRTGGYACKTLRGHTGRVVGLVYVNETSPNDVDFCMSSATVCSASSDGTVQAWDVHKGELLWCSPVQNPLTAIAVDEQRSVVITADSRGLIKTWQAQTGQELASYSTGASHCTLLQYSVSDEWFLSVGTSRGSVCTLAGSGLTEKSNVMVCDTFKVNTLLVSPDKKWVTAGTKDNHDFSPKVMYTESLNSLSEDEDPLSQSLPVTGLQAAVFIPTQPSRLAIVYHSGPTQDNKVLTVLDVSLKKSKYKTEIQVQQVASFPLPPSSPNSHVHLLAKDSNCIILAENNSLQVYSLTGALLGIFKAHIMPISGLCVDNFRVVTASKDLSLRVLTWTNNRDRGVTLESRYHLLGGSHTMSRGFTHVACDYSSIVASVESKDGNDTMKAYSFTH